MSDTPDKPDCYECKWRREIPGDHHSCCANATALVTGHPTGIGGGWFMWPFNFDPRWLQSCDGFRPDAAQERKEAPI